MSFVHGEAVSTLNCIGQIFYRLARNTFTSVFKITRQPKKLDSYVSFMLHDHEAQIVHSFKFCRPISKYMLCLFYNKNVLNGFQDILVKIIAKVQFNYIFTFVVATGVKPRFLMSPVLNSVSFY